MLSLKKLEIERDTDGPSRVGDTISGTIHADLSDDQELEFIELWFERESPDATHPFEPVRLPAELSGPGRFEVPFLIDVPAGAFSHDSKRVPVELSLVASASAGAGLKDGRLPLNDESPARVAGTSVDERVFEGDGEASRVPALVSGLVTAAVFAFVAVYGEFPTPGIILSALFGLVGGGLMAGLWWEDDDKRAKVSLNLHRMSLVLAPGAEPSTVTATVELDVPAGAKIERVSLRWIGCDGVLKDSKKGSYWNFYPFLEREVVLAKDGELQAARTHRMQTTFALPNGATPTYFGAEHRVRWYTELQVEFSDAETQTLETEMEVVQLDSRFAAETPASPVAEDEDSHVLAFQEEHVTKGA